ncbi:MAG: metallophosphoesterase [Candidatus Aenigmarchaeota archaeon]|nr:metallophosphoesterase [Candidatus Aenigmarchaeota archaeon]
MKYFIAGDFHGSNLEGLEFEIEKIDPDVAIFTGDYDQVKTIHQARAIQKDLKRKGKKVVNVPGNHDEAILNDMSIWSGTLRRQGKTSEELHEELMQDKEAKDFIDGLVNSKIPGYTNNRVRIHLDEEQFGDLYQTIVIHGGYDGSLRSWPNCPEEIKNLWVRLNNQFDHKKNFDVMESKEYKVMLRGHDHEPSYTYNDPKKGIVTYEPKGEGDFYRLFEHRQHTITPGAFFDGWFALIDTKRPGEKVPTVEYRKMPHVKTF